MYYLLKILGIIVVAMILALIRIYLKKRKQKKMCKRGPDNVLGVCIDGIKLSMAKFLEEKYCISDRNQNSRLLAYAVVHQLFNVRPPIFSELKKFSKKNQDLIWKEIQCIDDPKVRGLVGDALKYETTIDSGQIPPLVRSHAVHLRKLTDIGFYDPTRTLSDLGEFVVEATKFYGQYHEITKHEDPMVFWEETDKKGITARCTFDPEKGKYTVDVFKGDLKRSETFEAVWPDPRFGMDTHDSETSLTIADKLFDEVEKAL